jgi:hypothetical protein
MPSSSSSSPDAAVQAWMRRQVLDGGFRETLTGEDERDRRAPCRAKVCAKLIGTEAMTPRDTPERK